MPVKPDRIRELEERATRLGLSGAMITEYPAEDRRYDQSESEKFWAAAAALDMPLSLHTATRRQAVRAPHHIVDADDVAQANADGVLLKAQADVYAASLSRLKPPGPKAMT